MSETVVRKGNSDIWTAENMGEDLRVQGKLEINSLGISALPGGMDYVGLINFEKPFNVTWIANRLLMVSMGVQFYDQALIDAFTLVLGYPPFIRYQRTQGEITLQTTEWSKGDIHKAWMDIQNDPQYHDIELLTDPNPD